MYWPNVKLILQREVRDQLRDRRTLFMIAVLPLLLYPLLGMSFFQIAQFMREEPTEVLVVGDYHLPGVPPLVEGNSFAKEFFSEAGRVKLLELKFEPLPASATPAELERLMADARHAVQSGKFQVVAFFPPDFSERLAHFRENLKTHESGSPAKVTEVPSPTIFYNTAKEKSQIAYARVSEVLGRWTDAIGRQNLKDSQVPPATAKPFTLTTDDVAEVGQTKAALWSKILPFVLLLWALTGAFYPAVDLCAGEKERGTLETLLSSPAERIEIVCGKLLTVMLFSAATAILNLLSMGITGSLVLSQFPDLGPPPALAIVWLLVALVPVSALFSALCLALAAFARSTKEGQYYLMPLVLVTMPLTVLPMAPGVELNLGNSVIPITGIVLLLRTMLEGNYALALPYIPLVVTVTLACCVAAVRWAADQFNDESVLFRESERLDVGLWIKQLLRDREDTPGVAEAIFCGILILMIRFFMSFAIPATDAIPLSVLAVVTQLVVVATPALLMTIMLTRSPSRTLLLRVPPLMAVPAALLLALAVHPVASKLQHLVQWMYPVSQAMKDELSRMAGSSAEEPLWVLLLAIAIVPAVCEELAFRGFVLSGLRHWGHKWRAIVVSSIFFGVTHAIFQQSLLACLLGAVLGYLAVQTGSILPGMVFHAVHNSLAVLAGNLTPAYVDEHPALHWFVQSSATEGFSYRWPTVLAGLLISMALLVWFRNLPYSRSSEESLQEAIDRQSTKAVNV